jgi:thioredoxin reductase
VIKFITKIINCTIINISIASLLASHIRNLHNWEVLKKNIKCIIVAFNINDYLYTMKTDHDVIIVGGSYAGLSAAMSLGRALISVLIIDSGKPCNRQTPHSHNFITHDGATPAKIASEALTQVLRYTSVQFKQDNVVEVIKADGHFTVFTASGDTVSTKKVLFATGVADILPEIDGLAECWGISVLHCPFCHGYEVKDQPTGIIAKGEMAYEYAKLIHNWTSQLTLFTNGPAELTLPQLAKLSQNHVNIVEAPISSIDHKNGYLTALRLAGGSTYKVKTVYTRPEMQQHSDIPQALGCNLTEAGYLMVDDFLESNIKGIYAAGDNITPMRSVANAVAMGNKAGAFITKALISF